MVGTCGPACPGMDGQPQEAVSGASLTWHRMPPTPSARAPAEPGPSPTGVAEQFAITEATLSAWSSLDDEELPPENSLQDVIQLQGTARRVPGRAGCGRAGAACPLCPVTSDKPLCPSALVFLHLKNGAGDPCPAHCPRSATSIKERKIDDRQIDNMN